ncbi:MAG TPA: PAS domain S-box protein [Gemmatimonadaceae bacterium]
MADSPLKSKDAPRSAVGPSGQLTEHAHRDAASFVKRQQVGHLSDDTGGLYRLLVETIRDYAIFALDPHGYVLSWNAGAQRFKGYEAAEIIGKHFSVFYPEIDKWKAPQELEIAERDGRVEDEGWRVRKDGTQFWANVVITALRDKEGVLVGFAKVTRDLTERRAAELRISASEQQLRLIVNSVRDYGIFMLDPTGRVLTWNEGAEAINGYSETEIVGQHFSVFYPPEDIAAAKPDWELEIVAREGRFEDEGWRVRKDGQRFWANVVITALRDKHGTLVGFAKVTRDLTERKAAEEREIDAARRAAVSEEANRTKSTFLAAMSHELRTPLNAIGGYAEILTLGIHGPVTEPQREALHRITRSQQVLLSLINDVLNFAKLDAGQVHYRLAPVRVRDVLGHLDDLVAPQLQAKELTYQLTDCDESIVATADPEKLQQVVLNLLSNAIKFTPKGGRIGVSCAADGAWTLINVSDTGVGIEADRLGVIFDPFVQVDRTLRRPHEGVGLGLSISRDLVRGMGGTLTVRSTPGAGSTFTVRLRRPDA